MSAKDRVCTAARVALLAGLCVLVGAAGAETAGTRTAMTELRPWRDDVYAPAQPAPGPRVRYLKGQTHAHSNHSPDSQTPPVDVARWYRDRGYDFLVFTDHEHVTELQQEGPLLVIPGAELTQNWYRCSPPPEPGDLCLLHANVLFVQPPVPERIPWPRWKTRTRVGIYQRAIEVASRMGGLLQLNHPNYHYAADAGLITELARRGVVLMEIANEAVDSNNQGDARHPSTEVLWDAALTAGVTIYGVATDDAHHYYDARRMKAAGQLVHTGDRGYIMVRAEKTADSIKSAVLRGDFYSSNGVHLDSINLLRDALELSVSSGARGVHHFQFIGARGRVLMRVYGRQARFPLEAAKGGYVRAVVTDDRGRKAWVQPVRVP